MEYQNDTLFSLKICEDTAEIGEPSAFTDRIFAQIGEYSDGRRKEFDIPYQTIGTPFQQKVWRELAKIPYGQTVTYGQIAAAIGHPKAVRAVGGACNKNPLWLIIPCHRVIGANGSLTGYAGGVAVKEKLLSIEKEM